MLKIKNIPTNQQIVDEFGLDYSTVTAMKRSGSSRYELYKEAWHYRMIVSYASITHYVEPSPIVLADMFNTTKSNIYTLRKKRSATYELYKDVWNFRMFLKKLEIMID